MTRRASISASSTMTSWMSLSSSGLAGLCFALDVEPDSFFHVAWAITAHLYTNDSPDIVLQLLRRNHPSESWVPSFHSLGETDSATVASLLQEVGEEPDHVGASDLVEGQHRFYLADYDADMVVEEIDVEGPAFILCVDGSREPWKVSIAFPDASRREEAEAILGTFRTIYHRLLSPSTNFELGVGALDILAFPEAARLAAWNGNVQDDRDECIHDIVEAHARQTPNALAVRAWDGNFTYLELHCLSDTVAASLTAQGAKVGDFILTLMSKSKWNMVATLAIFKAGCVFTPLDPKSTPSHVRNIGSELSTRCVITNVECPDDLLEAGVHLISNVPELAEQKDVYKIDEVVGPRSRSSAMATAYFTSGSTGQPKGVIHDHRAICNGIRDVLAPFHIDNQTKCLQLSSPAFDVTVSETLTILYAGGCICVPTEHGILDSMNEEMAKLEVTHAFLTPTLAGQLDPKAVPTLDYLILGGEAMRKSEMTNLSPHLNLINSYGGTEMGVWDTATHSLTPEDDHRNIGKTVGANIWVVHPYNHDLLLPSGAIGEILVESTAVARGYHQPVTRRAFLGQAPVWRHRFGRQGSTRFYLSGDLGQYEPNGSLLHLGRKDTQVKLRGLRIELGEVEYHLRQSMSRDTKCVADVVKLPSFSPGEDSAAALTAFLVLPGGIDDDDEEGEDEDEDDGVPLLQTPDDEQRLMLAEARDAAVAEMTRVLPTYSVPTVFIPLNYLPLTVSGKTDRLKLKKLVAAMTPEEFASLTDLKPGQAGTPMREIEKQIQSLWAQALGINPGAIGKGTNFFHIGGDSIAGMKMAAMARGVSVPIGFADVQRFPILEDLAAFASPQADGVATGSVVDEEPLPAFSLISGDSTVVSELRDEAARQCGVATEDIEDIYPCTPLQQGLISLTAKDDGGSYISRKVFALPGDIRISDFQSAWNQAASCHPLLRTRLIDAGSQGILQTIVRGPLTWTNGTDLDKYQSQDRSHKMGFGTALSRYGLVKDSDSYQVYFVWTIHHSVYDGWTLPILQEAVRKAYMGQTIAPSPAFNHFIKHVSGTDSELSRNFWASYLGGSDASFFPPTLTTTGGRRLGMSTERQFSWSWTRSNGIQGSTLLRAAWAAVAGTYSGTRDVVFGTTLGGRSAPIKGVAGLHMMTAPTLATIPVRVRWEPTTTVLSLLETVQREGIEMAPFEQTGLQNIARAGADAQAACQFTSLFIVQPPSDVAADGSEEKVFGKLERENYEEFDVHPLSIDCEMDDGRVRLAAEFDSRVLGKPEVERLLAQFEHTLAMLGSNLSSPMSALDLVTPADRVQIELWNAAKPQVVLETAHALVKKQAAQRPNHTALEAWDGKMTYAELDDATDRLAGRLVSLGVGSGTLVPISFEKSVWAIVAMIAVLKAGSAFAVLDPAHPEDRKTVIVEQLKATVALVSPSAEKLLPANCVPTVVVCDKSILTWARPEQGRLRLPLGNPKDAMYVIFTSGSTGTPKGCLTEHWAFCSSMHAVARDSGIGSEKHVLQFASFSFDTSLEEIFCTLFSGATLHIPSEHAKMNDLAGEIRRTKTDWIELTPKVASLLDPSEVPTLKTIILGGDRSHGSDICRWPAATKVLNSYGCTEASVTSTLIPLDTRTNEMPPIGKGVGCNLWIVQVGDHNKLAPVGAPGELLIEGPGLARGYLGDVEKTAKAFVVNPQWAAPLSATHRQEQQQDRRFYRTGDLVRFNNDGAVLYIDRIDSQVKIRGQRVELGEIEHHLSVALPGCRVVADIVAIKQHGEEEGPGSASLTAFVVIPDQQNATSDRDEATACLDTEALARVVELRAEAVAGLSRSLPRYMIPDLFVPVSKMPLTVSQKTDRRRLKTIAQALTWEQVAALQAQSSVKTKPRNEAESKMRDAWAKIFGVAADKIGIEDDFFRIGGDSIAAIRMVAAAGKLGISTSVAAVFGTPVLSDLVAGCSEQQQVQKIEPFSLLEPASREQLVSEAASQCGLRADEIEDLYPCTPLQESLVSLTARHHGSYVMRQVYTLPANISLANFHSAWEQTAEAHPILRTRIVSVDSTMLQAVTTRHSVWSTAANLNSYLEHDAEQVVEFGVALSRYAIILHDDKLLFVWTIHHAIYDGWSLPLLLDNFISYYNAPMLRMEPAPAYNLFISHLRNMDRDAAHAFWTGYLEGTSTMFPAPRGDQSCRGDAVLEESLDLAMPAINGMTPAIILRAAWALVTHSCTGEQDIVFGSTVNGRNAPVPGIERMSGPTFATVPFRVRWGSGDDATVRKLLEDVRRSTTEMMPFEQMGLHGISSVSHDARAACQFQALFVVQQEVDVEDNGSKDAEFDKVMVKGGQDDAPPEAESWANFTTYPLVIECTVEPQKVSFLLNYSTAVLERPRIASMMRQFKHIVAKLACGGASLLDSPVSSLDLVSAHDRHQIQTWNEGHMNPIEKSMQQLFSERAVSEPTRIAVSAWDGEMTYAELDAASTQLAGHLRRAGVGEKKGEEEMVLICFEKSHMAIVSMLAILKAGGAFVALDPAQPNDRMSTIMDISKARLVLTSSGFQERLKGMAPGGLSVMCPADLLSSNTNDAIASHYTFENNPDSLAYVIFTSGSTGVPKGVLITHRAASSSIIAHGHAFGVDSSSRTLQFASFGFDACIFEIFTTLATGGCICIPSDADRINDLAAAITDMSINTAMLTPSVLALLDPAAAPSLRKVIFIAEQVSDKDIQRWAGQCRTLNGYGPTECTVVCVVEQDLRVGGRIGKAVGCQLWVVEPNNMDRLVPVGCPGELLVESPSLARGYLNDEVRTNEAFVWNPAWSQHSASTPRRFYKTGDLVRQTPDGAFMYLGRKDTQIKLRGLRIELGEVDHHLKRTLPAANPVVSDLVQLQQQKGDDTVPALAAFVVIPGMKQDASVDADSLAVLGGLGAGAIELLRQSVPTYMVPSIFIPIPKIPLTVSSKADRMALKTLARRLSPRQQEKLRAALSGRGRGAAGAGSAGKRRDGDGEGSAGGRKQRQKKMAPRTEVEKQMRQAWSKVLMLEPREIGVTDNFFRLGGDSISAMKLVPASRTAGVPVTVADVFRTPVLADLCAASKNAVRTENAIAPFSLLPAYDQLTRQEAARQCKVQPEKIEDLYPCTPLQQGLLSLSAKEGGSYTAREVFRLRDINIDDFQRAWTSATQAHPILRTRLVHLEKFGTLQAIVSTSEAVSWPSVTGISLEDYLKQDSEQAMGLGTSLNRFAIVRPTPRGDAFFVWTKHHAIFDGWTRPILRESVAAAFSGLAVTPPPNFNAFIKYNCNLDVEAANGYWATYLQDSSASTFPVGRELSSYHADGKLEVTFPWQWRSKSGVTASIALRTAWALVVGVYTSSSDVVFGTTLSGRNAPVPGVEMMSGPTIATVPVRVSWDADSSVSSLLSTVQQQSTDMIPFEQVGLQAISKVSTSATAACQFRSLFLVQAVPASSSSACSKLLDAVLDPIEITEEEEEGEGGEKEAAGTHTYPLSIEAFVVGDTVEVMATYDKKVLDSEQVQRIVAQLKQTLAAFANNPESAVSTLNLLSPADSRQIREWNRGGPPAGMEESVHDLVHQHALATPSSPAISAWDGDLTYDQLDKLANNLAARLRAAGVGPGTIVPISFEKSQWVAVAILAILKTGGAFVALDAGQPAERLRYIVEQVGARVMVASQKLSNHAAFAALPLEMMTCSMEDQQQEMLSPYQAYQIPGGDALAYVVFTSGSTGVPKGVMVSHSATASSTLAHGSQMGMTSSSRVLQFASYLFDASILEVLGTLIAGGCVCIPSAEECLNNLNQAVRKYDVNFAALAPRVASMLRPDELPSIKAIALGAEVVRASDIDRWQGRRVTNGYGPTECTVVCVAESTQHRPGRIGKGVGCNCWVVDSANADRLAPIGAAGELLIEGPCLARGYLNQPEKTDEVFVTNLPWAQGRRFYKTGDLVRYDADGGIVYIGRKDTQIKLRGQRIELGEVEFHVSNVFPACQIAVDIVTFPQASNQEPALAAFFNHPDNKGRDCCLAPLEGPSIEYLTHVWAKAASELSQLLPSYMVPTVFVPLGSMPLTTSGKTDRRKLQSIAATVTAEQLDILRGACGAKKAPKTETEKVMHAAWAQTLGVDPAKIGIHDNFFRLGGDSVSAMRLVPAAAAAGLLLRVADVFRLPVLEDLCALLHQHEIESEDSSQDSTPLLSEESEGSEGSEAEPGEDKETGWSLVNSRVSLLTPASSMSDLSMAAPVKKPMAPATDFQALSFEFAHLRSRGFVNYFSFAFLQHVSRERIRAAVTELVRYHSILRTSFSISKGRLWQEVTPASTARPCIEILYANGDAAEFASTVISVDESRRLAPGEDTTKFFIVESSAKSKDQSPHLVMRLAHSHYDGLSFPLMLQTFSGILAGRSPTTPEVSFSECTIASEALSNRKSLAYWSKVLKGSSSLTPIITPKGVASNDGVEGLLTRLIPLPNLDRSGITFAAVLKAAWAVVLAQHSRESEAVFGCLVSGRIPLRERYRGTVGPCVNLMPVRLSIAETSTRAFLQDVKNQHINSMEHEHMGFRRIATSCTDWPARTSFAVASIVQHQNIPLAADLNEAAPDLPFELSAKGSTGNAAAVWIITTARPDEELLSIDFSYAQRAIPSRVAENLLHGLCVAIEHFSHNWDRDVPLPRTIIEWEGMPAPLPCCPDNSSGSGSEDDEAVEDKNLVGDSNLVSQQVEDVVTDAWQRLYKAHSMKLPHDTKTIEERSSLSMFDAWNDNLVAIELRGIYNELGVCLDMEELLRRPTMGAQLGFLSHQGL